MNYDFDPEELTKEKSLWDVYKLIWRIKPSKFNALVLGATVVLLGIHVYIFQRDVEILLSDIRTLANLTLNFSLSVLGFLIAGFTIFATLSKPEMLLTMMDVEHEETGLPYLKYNFMAFMRVFVHYLLIALFCLLIILFGSKGGLVAKLVASMPDSVFVRCYIIKMVYIAVGAGAVHLLLILKTFIFNIYSIFMTQLRWQVRDD